jgi:hypothetical protein
MRGQCTTQTVPDKPQGIIKPSEKGQNVTLGLMAVTGPLSKTLEALGSPVTVTPSVTASDQVTLTCCEALKMQDVQVEEAGFSGSITFTAPKFALHSPLPPFEPLAITIPKVGDEGLFGQFSGSVGAGFSRTVDDCKKTDCYKGTVALGVTGNFFFDIGDPDILSGQISISSGFGGTVTADCLQLTASITFSGIVATAKVTFLDLSVDLGTYPVVKPIVLATATYAFK